MEQLQWERLQDLFSRAVELSTEARSSFVLGETDGDPELRKELLELLEFDTGASRGAITQALGNAIDATSREQREAWVNKVIGHYRLISVLGHGGTGTVYLAERTDLNYSGKVAIKLVHSAMVHGALGARFRAERQILARLHHANISRVLDAGETDGGQPYLVMEYVDGEPLDYFADRQTLDLRDRLLLFLEICGAVQYAHQNLIVHRDLKPANILVTADGVPKLLDFGIAKLLDGDGNAVAPALTRLNDRLLTPEYASPEQILGQAITTASDVYALGVLLYELLTGLRPYPVPGAVSQLELERLIREADPDRPSSAVRRCTHGSPSEATEIASIAEARRLSAEQLHKRLKGDLDAIVLRALRKEPQHRYPSVEQLAADIRRHLDNEPVRARQGNWAYYSQRFIRRHAFGVSMSATFVAVGIAFLIAMSIQTKRIAAERDRATQESKRAETVSDFMLEVFSASDPFTSQGHETTARELLDVAAKRIQNDLTQQPEVRARLLEAIGRSYRCQNETGKAIEILEEALRIRRQLPDPDGSKTGSVLVQLETAQRWSGDNKAARETLKEAMHLAARTGSEHSLIYAAVLQDLGRIEQQNGKLDAARKYLQRSLDLDQEFLGSVHEDIADILSDLETIALWTDDLGGADKLAHQALTMYQQTTPELHPNRVAAEVDLGDVLLMEGRTAEALTVLERALAHSKLLFGETSRQVANIYVSLANARVAAGRLDEAEDYSRRSIYVYRRSVGDDHYQTAFARTQLATILTDRGKLAEAESLLRQCLESYSRTVPPDHQYVASSEYFLGEVLLREGHLTDAEATLTASMNRWKRADAAPWRVARSQSALGEVLHRQGKYKQAERYLVESYEALASDEKADRDARLHARERLVHFYQERGQTQRLRALHLQSSDLRASS